MPMCSHQKQRYCVRLNDCWALRLAAAAAAHACGGMSEELQLIVQLRAKHCLFHCLNSSAEVLRLSSWAEADEQVFLCIVAGNFFFFSFSLSLPLSLSWRQTYVRGESLPTAPLCFCFSQWANVSLPRPHSLSSRPLSWKHSLAEATQGQACEVGGWGGLFQQITWFDPTVIALHEAQMLQEHFSSQFVISMIGCGFNAWQSAWGCK